MLPVAVSESSDMMIAIRKKYSFVDWLHDLNQTALRAEPKIERVKLLIVHFRRISREVASRLHAERQELADLDVPARLTGSCTATHS